MTVKTIDITPTWSEILPLILMALDSGKADGVKTAIGELNRMAECADRWNNHVKELGK